MVRSRCRPWMLLMAMGVLSLGGCGSGVSDEDLGIAEESVRAGLDAWKRGEQPAALQQLATPIEFHDDDWLAGAKLVDFKLTSTYRDTDERPRCAVTLTVEYRAGRREDKLVTYEANLDQGIVVARDPMS